MACFSLDGDQGGKKVTVGIDWKTGIAAKDWDTVARKEKIEVNELCFKRVFFMPYADDLINIAPLFQHISLPYHKFNYGLLIIYDAGS